MQKSGLWNLNWPISWILVLNQSLISMIPLISSSKTHWPKNYTNRGPPVLAITESLEVIPNHRILPWLATITWPWHSFLRVFFKIASIGLTQNFHILTHQNITIYWFCQKEEGEKNWFVIVIVTQIFCVKISVLSVSATVRKLSVIMWIHGKKIITKKFLVAWRRVWCDFFFHWRLNLKKVA